MATVALSWTWIYVVSGETWKRSIRKKLLDEGLDEEQLQCAVYVIRLCGEFLIRYPGGKSPVVYIGEGNLQQRLASHNKLKSWMHGLAPLIDGYSFEIGVVCPRVRRSPNTYKDLEAHLIYRFADLFGRIPLRNLQFETQVCEHKYSEKAVNRALKIGQGVKYHWAVEPLKSVGPLYDNYHTGWNKTKASS